MNIRGLFFVLFVSALLLAGCASRQPDFDVRGDWNYTMTATDGNTYDAGTITFSGEAAQGTYHQINIYQVEYEGDFTVDDGTTLVLTGDESWEGTITDANSISGTWSHADGASGTFTASRK